jgi:hypothetical protein
MTSRTQTRSRTVARFQYFNDRIQKGRFVPVSPDLRATLRIIVGDPERETLYYLYEVANELLPTVPDDCPDWVSLRVALADLAGARWVSAKAVTRHLRLLHHAEVIELCHVGSGHAHLKVMALPLLLSRLLKKDRVVRELSEYRPDRYSRRAISGILHRIEEDMGACKSRQPEGTSGIAVFQATGVDVLPAPATPVTPPEPGAMEAELVSALEAGIQRNFQTNFTLAKDSRDLVSMRRLVEEFGPVDARRMVEWVVCKSHWVTFQRQFNVRRPYPTPGVLLGFARTIFPLSVDGYQPQLPGHGKAGRSGGAEMYERPERDERDRLDF